MNKSHKILILTNLKINCFETYSHVFKALLVFAKNINDHMLSEDYLR